MIMLICFRSNQENEEINIIDEDSDTKDKIVKVIKLHSTPVKFIKVIIIKMTK